MKTRLLSIILLLISFGASAQVDSVLSDFNASINVFYATGSAPTFRIQALINNTTGRYSSTDVQVGDIIYLNEADKCVRFRVDVVSAVGSAIQATVTDIEGVVSGFPLGIGFITRETANYSFPLHVDGVSSDLLSCARTHFSLLVDRITGGGADTDSIYYTLNGDLVLVTRKDTIPLPSVIDTTFASNDTLYIVSGGDTTFAIISTTNTDKQSLSLVGDSLLIERGTGVDLSVYRDTFTGTGADTDSIYFDNRDSIKLILRGDTISLPPDLVYDGDSSITNELQDIDSVVLSGNLLTVYISNGASASVDLSGITLTDRADTSGYNLTFYIENDSLNLTDGIGNLRVDLSPYLDNTDTSGYNQTLSLSNDTLYLTDGASTLQVYIPSAIDTSFSSGDTLFIVSNRDTNAIVLSVPGDNWGAQVVVSDATLDGDGRSVNPLKIAQQGATSGQVLKWNGSTWQPADDIDTDTDTDTDEQNLSLLGDSLLIERGTGVDLSVYRDTFIDTNTDGDTIYFNNRYSVRLIVRGDTIILPEDLVYDGDSSVTNELQNLTRISDSIQITNGTSVYIGDLLDNTDDQNIDSAILIGTQLTIYIENGNSATVDLSTLQDGFEPNTDTDSIYFDNGFTTELITRGETITLPPDLVNDADSLPTNELQDLSRVGDSIQISNGTGVYVADFFDNTDTDSILVDSLGTVLVKNRGDIIYLIPDTDTNTDEQNLILDIDSLKIDRGTGVNLSKYLDNTDNQNIDSVTFSNNILTVYIEDGANASVNLSSISVTDTDSQTLSIINDTLIITRGNSVALTPYLDNTDTSGYNLDFRYSDDTIFIKDGNSELFVVLPSTPINTDTDSIFVDSAGVKTYLVQRGGTIYVSGDEVDDADADPSNEIQVISKSNDTVYLSKNGEFILDANIDSFYINYYGVTTRVAQGDTFYISNEGIYPDGYVHCDSANITKVVDVVSPTGKVWMDRNLGASRVAQSSTDSDSYGDLYQWGRFADGHQCRNSDTTSVNATTSEPLLGNFWDGKFILEPSSPYDWLVPQDDNLWQGLNGVNNPCPSGYRLPTLTEFNNERLSWSSNNNAGSFSSNLKFPITGSFDNLHQPFLMTFGLYWTSSVSGTGSYLIYTTSANSNSSLYPRSYGYAVRCIKETTNIDANGIYNPDNEGATAQVENIYIDTKLDFDNGLLNIDATNTEIRMDAKLDLEDGNQNQHIGENAGKYISGGVVQNLVPSNSIYIGSRSEAEADGQTNQIVIGYDATGNGSNTTTIGKGINEVYIDGIESSTIANAANVYVDASNRLWRSTTGAGLFDTIYASGSDLIFVTTTGDTSIVTITLSSDNWGTQVVISDSTLDGDGTASPDELKIAQQGATDNQALKWDAALGTWKPADVTLSWSDGGGDDVITLSDGGGSVTITDDVNDADADPNNEIQTISKAGLIITLSDGGGTVQDSVIDDDADSTNELQSLSWSAGTNGNDEITLSDGGGSVTITDDVNDADADSTNEIQSLTFVNDTLTLSKANSVVIPDSFLSGGSVKTLVSEMVTSNTETLIDVTYDAGNQTLDFVVNNDLSQYDNSTSSFLSSEVDADTLNELQGFIVVTGSNSASWLLGDNPTTVDVRISGGNNIQISDGAGIALGQVEISAFDTSGYNKSFQIINDTLSISDADTSLFVILPPSVDSQLLGWTQDTGLLTLDNSPPITIQVYDGVTRGLVPDSIDGRGAHYLDMDGSWKPLIDNDNQNLSLLDTNLTITGGNTISLAPLLDFVNGADGNGIFSVSNSFDTIRSTDAYVNNTFNLIETPFNASQEKPLLDFWYSGVEKPLIGTKFTGDSTSFSQINLASDGRFDFFGVNSIVSQNSGPSPTIALGGSAVNITSGDFSVDGSTLFVDESTNRIGIGTSSPFNPLHVIGTTKIEGRLDLDVNNGSVHIGLFAGINDTTGFANQLSPGRNTMVGNNSLFAMSTGDLNVALGHSAGAYCVKPNGTVPNKNSETSIFIGALTRPDTTGQTNQIVIGYGAAGNGSNSTTIGNTAANRVVIKGIYNNTTGLTGDLVTVSSDGTLQRQTSSLRYKTDIREYTRGTPDLLKLRPIWYRSTVDDTQTDFAGFIAEELHDSGLQEYVSYDENGLPSSIGYERLSVLLTRVAQEQQSEIDYLKEQINSQNKTIQSLIQRIEALENK